MPKPICHSFHRHKESSYLTSSVLLSYDKIKQTVWKPAKKCNFSLNGDDYLSLIPSLHFSISGSLVGRHWTLDRVTVLIRFPFIFTFTSHWHKYRWNGCYFFPYYRFIIEIDHVQVFESARSASNKIQIFLNSMDQMDNISIYFRALHGDYIVVYHYNMLMQVLGYNTTIYSYANQYELHLWQTYNRTYGISYITSTSFGSPISSRLLIHASNAYIFFRILPLPLDQHLIASIQAHYATLYF